MSILDIQRGIAEAGRIRIGVKEPIGNGRSRPAKIDTFRLTSADKLRIEQAAELYGGKVEPWAAPAGPQYQVITEATSLDVVVPPAAMAFSQWYELWSAGGCQRRCDGETETIGEQACLCDPAERGRVDGACDTHTRLSVMLRDLPGLALWRIDTQGYYAARELAGAVEILTMAAGRGVMLPARLLLDQRQVKKIEGGKAKTYRFAVPRLDVGVTPGQLLVALPERQSLPQLVEGAERPKLIPVPDQDPFIPTIAEQSEPPGEPKRRANAAPEIPASGRSRATAVRQQGDDGYWRARTFADAQERGIDNDTLRSLAARMLDQEEEGFSMSTLDEPAWERLNAVVVALKPKAGPEEPDDVAAAFGGGQAPAPVAPAAPARPTPDTLVERLSRLAASSELDGPMTDAQRSDVYHKVIQPAGNNAFHAVFVAAFGNVSFASPTAAQVDAILAVEALFDDADLHATLWQDTADQMKVPA